MGTVSNIMPGGLTGNFLEFDDAQKILSPRIVGRSLLTNQPISWILSNISYKIEIHMSTAFVTIEGVWKCLEDCDCEFIAPMNQRATAVSCRVEYSGKTFESQVVSLEEVEKYAKEKSKEYRYDPDIFSFPFNGVQNGDEIHVSYTYFEFLKFISGQYRIHVPMRFEYLPPDFALENILSLHAIINSATSHIAPTWESSSHGLYPLFTSENRFELRNDPSMGWMNSDFYLSYRIAQNDIDCSVLYQEPDEEKGNFSVFVTPPEYSIAQHFPRRVIFILDKSGSMQGQPMEKALNAVSQAINTLTERDYFSVIAFSEHQYFFSNSLVPATIDNTSAAISWTQRLQAAGLTDIMTPLQNALDLLESSENVPETMNTIPSIFLITDGAVENERDICSKVKARKSNVRINTFGIGVYCNHYFLKQLALIGKGYSEVAYKSSDLYDQMVYLLNMTVAPVLTDVKIGIASSAYEIDITPVPIPDLFCGAPIIVSGSYFGYFPTSIFLMGTLPNNEKIRREIQCKKSELIPIRKISVKQRLDAMIAQAWLTNSNKIKSQAIELSCQESLPCTYTTMVGFQKTNNSKTDKALKDKKFRRNLLIGVGVVAVLGVAAYAFGDLAASMGAMPVDAIANAGTQGCGNCGNCNCDCGGDCGECGDCGGVVCCDCNCADGDCGCCGCEMDCAGADCGSCDCNC